MTPDGQRGLTSSEVAERAARGHRNVTTDENRRTFADIVRANVLTRFNAILGTLLVVVLATGEYPDALFGIVLVTNALVGIVQETRAKVTLDRLAVVSAPRARVVRDGAVTEIPVEEIVVDDVIEAASGDAVPVDGAVLTADGLEVDESLLTGESDPLHKDVGDEMLSGSFVVAGGGRFVATAVGDDAYAARLAKEAKRFATVHSELRSGTDTILKVATWVIAPVGVLLLISQLRSASSTGEALRGSVAGVGAIIPEGLILLTSVAFAVGVIRLGRRNALIQELAAVEVLARVDVVCVDKTGTLTQGTLRVSEVELVGDIPEPRVSAALAALAAADERPNASLLAIAETGSDPGWTLEQAVPFSSGRKWGGATFVEHGSWVLGAPDVLLAADDPLQRTVGEKAASGARVILLATATSPLGNGTPSGAVPVALIGLEEDIRAEAPDTIAFFREQGVEIKIISGDHPSTVGAVAERVGVPGGDAPIDARSLPEDLVELGQVLESSAVFGRVQPHQKRAMVRALQQRGHVVAMTGDGVNDVLALKDADMGVAMGSGSGASRGVAQLVLLDDSFASLPSVVAEGRRVIANVERVANLFVTKSVYAALLAVAVGIAQLPFPFFPRHLTIISSLTIGIPAFFLALAPNDRRSRPGFVGRVARFAVPAGAVAAVATFTGYAVAGREAGVTLVQERTSAVIVLFLVAMWVLVILARPFNEWKSALLGAMALTFLVTLATPGIREIFDLSLPPLVLTLAVVGVAAMAIGVLELSWQGVEWWRRRSSTGPDDDHHPALTRRRSPG
ncbi:MAG TPA: HAD-IC family P-type ATPase [Acidimicrobiales bacterium]|nr:HAD-IC family P-type ATPase [Acidimicrobiales bacterium]